MIFVTKPFFPPIEEYQQYLQNIWKKEWLTNNGAYVVELEEKLTSYLKVPNLLFLTNGTIALQIAIKALGLKGEIITTPFSYVATTSSIVWEGCTPVFVDIDAKTYCIDSTKIEQAITPKTTAILATHIYGNPCDVVQIEKIATKHNLKVIYDGAHAFGVKVNGKSVFEFGDISTTSFHATKLFHTAEGGAVFTKDEKLLSKMALLRNFGHTETTDFDGLGINGKNSELHAAMGLCNLKYIDVILENRKKQYLCYQFKLYNLNIQQQVIDAQCSHYNYAYYSIVLQSEEILLQTLAALERQNIFARRYFYPSLTELDYVGQFNCPVSSSISKRVLSLPLYHNLTTPEQNLICDIIATVNG
jgi:dTDP-4-amino-4,6-dideoxygalactose transaminase